MSYQQVPQHNYPPPGYGTMYPPAGYPSAPPQPDGYPYPPPSAYTYPPPLQSGGGYQGYFGQGYPPPPPPSQVYHCDHHHHHDDDSDCFSFLRGCLLLPFVAVVYWRSAASECWFQCVCRDIFIDALNISCLVQ
ncbi:hypothetical protein CASFOL_003569 [Castilleja foliolosa]|uniref:Rhodopsin n=1 Tax=Castilleja foliolosa TaxID=1961234 RepID=A0ABD3EHJ9_9LAMI